MTIDPNYSSLAEVDFTGPLEGMTGLPNIAYVSENFAQFERDEVLAKTWVCIGSVAQFPHTGWVVPVTIYGLPLLMVRDKDDSLRVFHNVCSHRGMILVDEPGSTQGIMTCPYHRWSYDLSGSLRATPHIAGQDCHQDPRFEKRRHGLAQVRTHLFANLVFVNLSGDAPDFDVFIKPVTDRWHMFDYRDFKHGGDDSWWSLRLRANWKFAQENHVDGYHLPSIHPGLNSYSPLKNHYPLMIDGCASGQGSTSQDHAGALGGLALPCLELGEDWHKRAEFLSVFPNIMMGVHKDHFWTVYLIPEAPDQTFERMDIYYPGDGGTNQRYADLRAANRDRMLEIFEEDRAVIEGMQRGRRSPAFRGGALSPEMDRPAHCFNKWAATSTLAAMERLKSRPV